MNIAIKILILLSIMVGPLTNSLSAYDRVGAGDDVLAVTVFAGNDKVICNSDTLNLGDLNASISGMVTNGYWFTNGDGTFLPCNNSNCRFTDATSYIPGDQDIATGWVDLMLVSDDPDGIGPMPQVVDQVRITLLGTVALACNSYLNISLNSNCQQLVTPNMLVTNIIQPFDFYYVELKDNTNKPIANDILTVSEINENVTYTVGHACGPITCWGNIYVQDKLPPPLACKNLNINCGTPTQADSLGLPVGAGAVSTKINAYTYSVANFDACTAVTLTYADSYTEYLCDTIFQSQLKRTWVATDGSGNKSSCNQFIKIKNKTFAQVVFPPNFDGISMPSLDCDGDWPQNNLGYPSPDTTGYPNVIGCTNMGAFYTDTRFELCGEGYKLLRVWEIINWCTSESFTQNQLIKIEDKSPPTFECPGDLTLGTSPYQCGTPLFTLPLPTYIEDCSDTYANVEISDVFTGIDYSAYVINNTNGTHAVNNLPVGIFEVRHIIFDDCSNRDTCIYYIDVIDDVAPIPICDQFTKVTLGSNGVGRMFAATLDDGSHDNCSPVTFKVSKNTTPPVFGDFVDYTCADLDVSQMAVLKITDATGNENSCMVQVDLQDKLPPVIHCPDDLTISCQSNFDLNDLNVFGRVVVLPDPVKPITIYDAYNNGIAGYDGYAQDNCKPVVTSTFTANLSCNQGVITRVFTATDQRGNASSCTQYIDVLNPDIFDITNIKFPPNVEINGCDTADAKTVLTGVPVFTNTSCATVGATFSDSPFFFTDNACVKILRTWTVIDWCQYDPVWQTGIWTGLQVIKLNNSVKPVLDQACRDTTVCLYAQDCSVQWYEQAVSASDDCTAPQDLKYQWNLDYKNDGTIDKTGLAQVIKDNLATGKHKAVLSVTDKCGNTASCSYIITVKDCKKPTPYCQSSISTAIMPSAGNLTITAQSFDLGSFDNCTPSDSLLFSFSSNTNQKTRTVTCADMPDGLNAELDLEIWVTDKAGNQEYCTTKILVSDNQNVCPDAVQTGEISGSITTFDNTKGIKDVSVEIHHNASLFTSTKPTDEIGYFAFNNVPVGDGYVLKPSLNYAVSDGINTLDIIKIQRHILGAERFTSPYQLIAADVDANKKISVTDLVILRKIVLKVQDKFPAQKPCWSFVSKSHEFQDNNQPYLFPDSAYIQPFIGDLSSWNDFYAVKTGDVNNSFTQLQGQDEGENRRATIHGVKWQSNEQGASLINLDEAVISGFELIVKSPGVDFGDVQVNTSLGDNFFFNPTEEGLKIIFYPTEPITIAPGSVLFQIDKTINTTNLDGALFDASLNEIKFGLKDGLDQVQEFPLVCTADESGFELHAGENDIVGDIVIFDVVGRVVFAQAALSIPSSSSYKINCNTTQWGKVYFLQLRFKNKIYTRKILF